MKIWRSWEIAERVIAVVSPKIKTLEFWILSPEIAKSIFGFEMSLSLMELETAINRGDDEVLSEGAREEERIREEERGEREGESLIVGCLNLYVLASN